MSIIIIIIYLNTLHNKNTIINETMKKQSIELVLYLVCTGDIKKKMFIFLYYCLVLFFFFLCLFVMINILSWD